MGDLNYSVLGRLVQPGDPSHGNGPQAPCSSLPIREGRMLTYNGFSFSPVPDTKVPQEVLPPQPPGRPPPNHVLLPIY